MSELATEVDGGAGGRGATGTERATRRAARVDRRLLRESRAARPHLLLAGLLGVATAVCAVAQAALIARIITRVAMDHASLSQVRAPLLALGAVFVVRALLAGAFELSGRLGAAKVQAELRVRLVEHLLVTRPSRAPQERTGELAAAAVQGVDSLESYFAAYLPSLTLAITVPAAVLIWVTPIDWITAVIFLVTIPVLIAFMILIGVGAQSRTRKRWQALSLLSSHFLDVVRGLETLRAHRRELAQTQILTDVGERYRRETMGTLRLAFLSALVLELCAMIGTGLVAATIGVQLTGGHLGLDAGLTVLLLAPELYAPLRQVGQQFHASADGLAAAERLLGVLDEPGLLCGGEVRPRDELLPRTAAPLAFHDVCFAYPGRPGEVLHDLDLTVEPHEFLALTGPSGSGKSTLAALALRLADPTSGVVTWGGVDLRELPLDEWRARTAWVPQRVKLFAGTLGENIALADPAASPERIHRAAEAAGLTELVAALPDGLDTRIGDGGRGLSAGQGQRVALARAFLSDAELVVLDEPTANLDARTAAGVGAAIAALSHGRTLIMITHDHGLACLATRTLELVDGLLPAQVLA